MARPKPTPNFKCRDCREMRVVRPRELAHVAQPRCTRCGGPLEPLAKMQEGLALIQTAMSLGRPVGRRAAVIA